MNATAQTQATGARGWVGRWVPLLAWMSLIFVLSDQPDLGPPGLDVPGLDKLAHVAEYAVLGLLLGRAARRRDAASSGGRLWLAAVGGLLWAGTDELHQGRVPGRCADWADLAADVAGLALGLVLAGRHGRRPLTRVEHA